jgi:hypothetical protein
VDDAVLAKLDKGHTRADFLAVAGLCREAGLALQPTFVPFTPWTTLEGYAELLRVLAENNLVENVAPIQLAIRLLIPAGSRLLELDDVRQIIAPFDEAALAYPWRHADPRMDALCAEVEEIVRSSEKLKRSREKIFERIWDAAQRAGDVNEAAQRRKHSQARKPAPRLPALVSRAAIPYLNEPWYC